MNYIHHALIGVGTASLGVMAAEVLGYPTINPVALGIGAVVAATGAIATDLDHPRSFISHSIPSRVIRLALAILAIPILSALAVLLTTRDATGTWNQLSALVMGWDILRWSFFAILLALGLIGLSWLLYRSLHHRGPLHSLLFTLGVTLIACAILAVLRKPWEWGLVFGWGWAWHILADGLTTEGVPLCWPINDERKHTLPDWALGLGRWTLSMVSIGGLLGLIFLRVRTLFT
jgi:membrane-bound metal-dependent hydrolase YbcI (DUF457 family)